MKTLLNSNDEQTESKFKLWQLIAAFGGGVAIVFAVIFVPKVGLQGYTKLDIEVECNGDKKCEINKKLDLLLEYFQLYTGTFNGLSNFTGQWTQFTGQWSQFTGQWTKFTGEMKEEIQETKEAAEEAAENTESGSSSSSGSSGSSSSSTEPSMSSSETGTEKPTPKQASGKKNVDNAVDTLVIVNSDDYTISEENIEDLFKSANKLWLEPKTNIKFSIIDTKIVSFSNENVNSYKGYLDKKYFKNFESSLPEYIVAFDKYGVSNINGGYMDVYQLTNNNKDYCNEFQSIILNEKAIPAGVIDYQHKFGACGYDDFHENIISKVSGNGECKNQDGLTCVFKNGYQMCPNLANNFYAQNSLNFTMDVMVHELLHAYGKNGNFDHFGTDICNKASGAKIEELKKIGISAPFDDLFQEYAGICPNVWENLKNSQKACKYQ